MEFFSYRNFLEYTQLVSWIGMILALTTALSGLLAPALRRKNTGGPALAGADGGVVAPGSDDSDSNRVLAWGSRLVFLCLIVALVTAMTSNALRYMEVRHWPAQTMYEVIPMGVTAGYLSTLALVMVLGINKMRGATRAFGDLFLALIFFGGAFTTGYVLGLDPTGKPLPPALQSYWFSTHITAYMIGYFTLFIAAVGAYLHFAFQFWRGVFDRKNHPASKLVLWGVPALALAAGPFGGAGATMGFGILAVAAFVVYANYRFAGGMDWFNG